MGERLSAEEVANLARDVRPEDVRPIPGNVIESLDEFERLNPAAQRELEAPRPGRRPAKPSGPVAHLKGRVQEERAAKGLPVRIDAEDAIDNGPAH